jgi:predicted RNA-binding protein with PUA-like domain
MSRLPDTGRFWLFKSEPNVFSFEDLLASKGKKTHWDGVRNYQARNMLRDDIKKGDGVLFYHSNAKPMVIAGMAVVVKEGYPDHTAFDPADTHFDPKSDLDNPTWYMVDIKAVEKFDPPLTRDELMEVEGLSSMVLLQRGSRLSVQPVKPKEWRTIVKIAGL